MKIVFSELPSRGVLLIQGPDTQKFLQGQTTCDLANLSQEQAVVGAYCTPQGRMVADFRIVGCGSQSWLMQMHTGICDNTAAVFGKYIVFSKAEISNVSADWRVFALWGSGAGTVLNHATTGENTITRNGEVLWVQTDPEGDRFECYVPAAQAQAFASELAQSFSQAPEQDWQRQEINLGIGHLEATTVDQFLPQMLNYQLTGRVSFSKGCYTGQEVVARLHYRGKLKRPMYLARVRCENQPPAGAAVYQRGSDQAVGTVVNAVEDGDAYIMLVVVASKAVSEDLHFKGSDQALLEFRELPYRLDD